MSGASVCINCEGKRNRVALDTVTFMCIPLVYMCVIFQPRPIKAGVTVVPYAIGVVAAGVKLVGVSQPKHMHRLSPNFQDMLTPNGSRAA